MCVDFFFTYKFSESENLREAASWKSLGTNITMKMQRSAMHLQVTLSVSCFWTWGTNMFIRRLGIAPRWSKLCCFCSSRRHEAIVVKVWWLMLITLRASGAKRATGSSLTNEVKKKLLSIWRLRFWGINIGRHTVILWPMSRSELGDAGFLRSLVVLPRGQKFSGLE